MRYIQAMSDMHDDHSEVELSAPMRSAFRNAWNPYENKAEQVEEICTRLWAGEPLAQICRDEHMAAARTVYQWMDADPQVETVIAQARKHGAHAIAVDALNIADNLTGDPQRDRLRVDTRLKLLAKWSPKDYGDSTQLRHADANGEKLDTQPLVSELMTMLNVTPDAGRSAAIGAKSPVGGGSGAPLIEAQAVYRPPARAKANQSVAFPPPAPVALHGPHNQASAAPARKAYKPRALRREDDVTDLV